MAAKTSIEWTRGADGTAGATWNPVTGCTVVSPGCANCYAMTLAGTRLQHHPSRAGLTTLSKAGPVWNGKVRLNEEWLTQPLQWKRPRMIFVCAHGDLFHESVPDDWIDRVFAVMALAPQHTFQVLTKRSARMRAYMTDPRTPARVALRRILLDAEMKGSPPICIGVNIASERSRWPLRNVWLGVSTEDQTRADERVPDLLATPAAIRFVSAEPLLGPIDFMAIDLTHVDEREREPSGLIRVDALEGLHVDAEGVVEGVLGDPDPSLDWIIVGGENGRNARPMHPAWARSIRDQCAATEVAFFFKQWGAIWPAPVVEVGATGEVWRAHADGTRFWILSEFKARDPVEFHFVNVGKARAGRLLDGVEHNGMPEARHAG